MNNCQVILLTNKYVYSKMWLYKDLEIVEHRKICTPTKKGKH